MLNIQEHNKLSRYALWQLGFRPFFLAATAYAVVAMLLWSGIYILNWEFPALYYQLSATNWHAHEMIYGYGMAVISGFLLTAIRNWSGRQTLRGWALAMLLLLWLSARVLPFFITGVYGLIALALLDIIFNLALLLAAALPLLQGKQWRNLAMIISKLLFLLMGNLLYYLGLFGLVLQGAHYGLYIGLYLILSLILLFSRRVLPFFIERGVGYSVSLKNAKWLDISSMLLFLGFAVADIMQFNHHLIAVLALLLAAVHALRLYYWHTPGIWKKPMLWILYLAYAWLIVGFMLKVCAAYGAVSPFIALHAFAVGGIGMMTCGMMLRVSLGHTGRQIARPPTVAVVLFGALLLSAVSRVLLPLIWPELYRLWVLLSQFLWVIGFAVLLLALLPMLIRARVDGQPG